MKLEKIDIKSFDKQSVRIACIQLESPFYEQIDKIRDANNALVFGLNTKCEPKYVNRTNKIHKIIDAVTKTIAPDFLVLPEYTFLKDDNVILSSSESSIDFCMKISDKTQTIIIGNYYDRIKRLSTTFVTLPENWAEKTFYHTNKQTVSTYDKGVLKDPSLHSEEERNLLKFVWTERTSKRKCYFQIFTCKDFLYFTSIYPLRTWPEIIDVDMPGIIFSPMSSPVITPFEDRSLSLIRDMNHKSGEKSIISVLCNATAMPNHEDNDSCGNSQIISPIDFKDEIKPILKKGVEGVAYAEVNPFKSITKPTVVNEKEANAVILDSAIYELEYDQNNYKLIELSKKTKHTGLIINPNFLGSIGIKKVYGFLRLDNYTSVKLNIEKRFDLFKNLSISIHGIYGVHDIICFSHEEIYNTANARELIKTRIWPMVKDEVYFSEDHFGCCCVDKTIKYRGIQLEDNQFANSFYNQAEIQEIKQSLNRYVSDVKIEENHKDFFVKNNILIHSEFDASDISDKEINEGKLEFLIILTLFNEDNGPRPQDLHHEFSSNVLSFLTKDNRIRTIEKITSEGTGFVSGHYFLHVVGDLMDLNDIVIGKLHKLLKNQKCGTRVIIPAEMISRNEFPCLAEAPKSNATEPQLIQIMKKWRDELESNPEKMLNHIIPSMINILDDDTRSTLLSIYYHADKLSSRHKLKHPDWAENLFNLMYGLTASIVGQKHNLKFTDEQTISFCENFVSNIAKTIERELMQLFENIAITHSLSFQIIEESLNELAVAIKNTQGTLKLTKIEIGTAAFIFECLNGYCCPESKYCDVTRKRFQQKFSSDEEMGKHLKCISSLCSELFNVHLADLEMECIKYFNEKDISEVRKILQSKGVTISSNLKISKTNNEIILRDRGEIFIIEPKKDRLHLHYQIITTGMIKGINIFVNNARNILTHDEYKEKISPQQILNGTYSGLMFLDNIARRRDRKLYTGSSLFGK